MINYGYGMLYAEVESAALTAGLDPHIGFLHREEYGKPAFVFDAIEPYRPWVDQLVAELALTGKVKASWFEAREGLVAAQEGQALAEVTQTLRPKTDFWLSKEGKKPYISAWYALLNEATLYQGKKIRRRAQIQDRLTTLAQHLFKTFQSE